MSLWPNKGDEDARPALGEAYQHVAPIHPRASRRTALRLRQRFGYRVGPAKPTPQRRRDSNHPNRSAA